MPIERNFVVRLPDGMAPEMIRKTLKNLNGANAATVTAEREGIIEFSSTSPGYAILKISILAPAVKLLEKRRNSEAELIGETPDWVEGIISCPNKNCITAQPKEPTRPRFRVVSVTPPKIQCFYCGRYVPAESLIAQLS